MKYLIYATIFALLTLTGCKGCKKDKAEEEAANPPSTGIDQSTYVKGYGILSKLTGIWNGPVSSSTPLGGYPEWIVDFRPVSSAQVSGKSELDTANSIFMSFFIVKNNSDYIMAFRNGGTFASLQRVAYARIDSVSETASQSFYRFIDYKKGQSRVYTDILFKGDSLNMTVYTNKYNTLSSPVLHMHWTARLQDTSSAGAAVAHFSYPQKQMVKDFSSTFNSQSEAIYYNNPTADPYNEAAQPYLGKTTVNISYGNGLTPPPGKKLFVVLTTQSLFSGSTYNASQLKYRSRYVILNSNATQYTFNYMHPGMYFVYTICDNDGNGTFSSGDYVASNLSNAFTLSPLGQATVNSTVDFTIP